MATTTKGPTSRRRRRRNDPALIERMLRRADERYLERYDEALRALGGPPSRCIFPGYRGPIPA